MDLPVVFQSSQLFQVGLDRIVFFTLEKSSTMPGFKIVPDVDEFLKISAFRAILLLLLFTYSIFCVSEDIAGSKVTGR